MIEAPAEERQLEPIGAVFREVYGEAVATLVRLVGDITIAEDAVQDAFVVATEKWPDQGVPANPAGWIVTTAKRRAIDGFRRTNRGQQLVEHFGPELQSDQPSPSVPMSDDRLRLIFTCCHPALRTEHQVALTLRLLGGLEVHEIAQLFLVGESAMAKRLVRAKYKISAANIPYRVPRHPDLPERLNSVLTVLYLIYSTGSDQLDRTELRTEAIRLARQLAVLMPDEPEVQGLLALLLLNESRIPARDSRQNVVLRDQNRSLWDRDLVAEGQRVVRQCIRRNSPGPFQLQAAIQAVHSAALRFEDTDWNQILANYNQLMEIASTPVIAMNRAIAVSEVRGPGVALAALEEVSELDGYYLFHATRGTLLRDLGRDGDADRAFATAATLAPNEHDRSYLESKLSGSTV